MSLKYKETLLIYPKNIVDMDRKDKFDLIYQLFQALINHHACYNANAFDLLLGHFEYFYKLIEKMGQCTLFYNPNIISARVPNPAYFQLEFESDRIYILYN